MGVLQAGPVAPTATSRCTVVPLPCLGGEMRRYRGVLQPFADHVHDTYVIGRVVGGSRLLRLNGTPVELGPGDAIVFNPGDVHGCDPLGETPFEYDSVTVGAAVFDDVRLRFPMAADGVAREVVDALLDSIDRGEPGVLITEQAMVVASLLEDEAACEPYGRELDAGPHGLSAQRVHAYLRSHLREPLRLEELARLEGLSPYAIIRAYRRHFSITPLQHLISFRVERACDMLARGASPSAVAAATGFCDQAHLTRVFKERMGTTPAAYAKMAGDTTGESRR